MKQFELALVGLAITAAIFILSGTEITLLDRSAEIHPRQDTDVPADLSARHYELATRYYQQDDIGLTSVVEEMLANVSVYDAADVGSYFQWTDCRFRSIALPEDEGQIETGIELGFFDVDHSASWDFVTELVGFSYYVEDTIGDDTGQLGNLPDVRFLRRDMNGFHAYIHLLDFHMWDIYTSMINDPSLGGPLRDTGDTIIRREEGHVVEIGDWGSIMSDSEMGGGQIYIEYIGTGEDNGAPTRLFFFEQHQRLDQRIHAPLIGRLAFTIPMAATNRFLGYFELDEHDKLVRGRFDEYVYLRVTAPFFIKMRLHSKREYSVARIEH